MKRALLTLAAPFVALCLLVVLGACAVPPPPATVVSASTTEFARSSPSWPTPEDTLREATTVERPLRDLADLARRLRGVSAPATTPTVSSTPPNYQVGRQDWFWLSDQKTYFRITATIQYVTPHAYFYVQDGEPFSAEGVRRAAEAFENRIYPLVRRYFGSEALGIDGDGHITILGADVPNVGGYFTGDDQYPRAVSPYSNERDIIYINTSSYPIGSRGYDATVAHELQHLISWTVNRTSDTWFNEGASEFAMELGGYDPGGAVRAYADNPNTQLTGWTEDDDKTLAHYGAGYLFLIYFAQQYGGYDAVPELMATGGRGTAPFDTYLAKKGYQVCFDDVFRDWVIANYLGDSRLASGRYGYQKANVRPKTERITEYPAASTSTISQYGVRYFELQPATGDLTITITGTVTSRLLANRPRSGQMQWWSNRGDLMDTTLTRRFDLRGLGKATLRYSAWYEIEEGFDYAYAQVSVDEGQTWTTLAAQHTTTDDPTGHNFGYGYTGKSGDGPAWVDESVDLTPYAGKQVLIRFEHVTDDAFNAPGFAVDDIAVPELGFFDDAEGSANGWQAEGFVRTANVIPQPYSVQLIYIGNATTVEPVPLDSSGRGQVATNGLGVEYQRAVLVVAPMAPVTSEEAPFEFSAVARP